MAEDFEDNRNQFQGDVIVPRPTQPGIHRSCIVASSTSEHSKNQRRSPLYNVPPSTSSDSTTKGNKGSNTHHNHNHNHHHNKRHHNKGKIKKDYGGVDRFSRTATVLRQAGLMKLTLQIAQLIKTNGDLQKDIDDLQKESVQFSENLKANYRRN
ncbi:hypothetical protein OS493_000972 [Desmophyllum pertusum]|uniref:Uncharacterized protein n=1 Tax=Desmophyllum pertusum TaxID=174260 RepID=A0A9W9ZTJ7_9CNID|nr:hypothetical protein OS493_000972 [Desmophyllum pertusum]